MDKRPDPLFRNCFYWPTHKDPKGTHKTNSVVVTNRQATLPVKRSRVPFKKKVLRTPKAIKAHAVTDEDFLLLQSFLSEISAMDEPVNNSGIRNKVKFTLNKSYHTTFFCRHSLLAIQNP